jgi:hypothetical protein
VRAGRSERKKTNTCRVVKFRHFQTLSHYLDPLLVRDNG